MDGSHLDGPGFLRVTQVLHLLRGLIESRPRAKIVVVRTRCRRFRSCAVMQGLPPGCGPVLIKSARCPLSDGIGLAEQCSMNPILQDKVCILTGATGGIGAAIARLLAAQGAKLMLTDMPGTPLAELAESLGAAWLFADAADDAGAKAYTDHTLSRFGVIDAVLANAGTEGRVAPISQSKPEDVEHVFAVNVFGPFSAIRHAAPHMKRGGSIVVTASVASFVGSPGLAAYCASKHALLGLVRSAAQELGPLGIRVNAIHPGPVDNRMMRSIEEQASPGNGDAVHQSFAGRIPMGRYATNEEIAAMAAFLVSDNSAYCNGASFVVDGGMLTA